MEKNPYDALQFDSSPYKVAKNQSLSKSNNLFDATIGEATNKSALAGSVQGAGNVSRLSADTFARVSEQRDQRNSQLETEFNMREVDAMTNFNNQKKFNSAQWEASQGSVFDTVFGLAVPALTQGIGVWDALNFGNNDSLKGFGAGRKW